MEDVISYVKKEYEKLEIDCSHDFVHAYNVYHSVCKILENDFSNESFFFKTVAKCCALTHDLCDEKYVTCKTTSAANVTTILEKIYSSEIASAVFSIITQMSFSKRLKHGIPNIEKRLIPIYLIVSDADMLESMGLIGFLRTFMYQAVFSSHTSQAYAHITHKLTNCKDFLHSPWAQKEGEVRHKRMVNLIRTYAEERVML